MEKMNLGNLIKLAKAGKIVTSDDMASAVSTAIAQSSGGSGSIADGSISVSKLDTTLTSATKDVIQVVPSKNLFNKATVIAGSYVSQTSGILASNANFSASDWIAVVSGLPYSQKNCDSQQYAWFNASKVFISGGTFANNTPVTAPANASYLRITMSNSNVNSVQIEQNTVSTTYAAYGTATSLSTLSSYPLQVNLSGTRTRIAWKYDENTDFWLDFDKHGASLLYQISNMWKLYNPNKRVNSNFSAVASQFLTASSDWVGPYIISAVNTADGNASSVGYTGGWHGANGDQTGVATARNVSYVIYADNVLLNNGDSIGANVVKIVVVNRIQAKNTVKTDGTGREVLEETVTYTITAGKVDVDVKSKALEEITISRYMGCQTVDNAWNTRIFFEDDSTYNSWQTRSGLALNSGLCGTSHCNSYLLNKNNDYLYAWVDGNYGLGRRTNLANTNPMAYSETYDKSYIFLLCPTTALDLPANSYIYWRGGYKFFRQ